MTVHERSSASGGDPMTGLRIPPGPARGARPDEACHGRARPPPPAAAPAARLGLVGWAALGLASADLHADRAGAALPAGRGQRARLGAAAAGHRPGGGAQYYAAHPALAPILARLSLFNVFAAPWFAAIYLLLFASLAGCVLPRSVRLVGSARQLPPQAPRNLARLPLSAGYRTALAPAPRSSRPPGCCAAQAVPAADR